VTPSASLSSSVNWASKDIRDKSGFAASIELRGGGSIVVESCKCPSYIFDKSVAAPGSNSDGVFTLACNTVFSGQILELKNGVATIRTATDSNLKLPVRLEQRDNHEELTIEILSHQEILVPAKKDDLLEKMELEPGVSVAKKKFMDQLFKTKARGIGEN
jgi:hypothetical protein